MSNSNSGSTVQENTNTSSNIFKRIIYYMNPSRMEPKRVKLWSFWIIFNIVLFLIPNSVTEGSPVMLLPIAGLFIYAIVSREVYEAVVLGAISMYILWYKGDFLMAFIGNVTESLVAPDVVSMIASFLLCGGMIVAFSRSGVTKSFGELITRKFGSNEKLVLTSAGVFTGAMSIDDYIASLTSGAAFSPLMDAMGKPRIALSFIIKTFSTCVSNLLPFGAWGYFVIYQIAAAETVDGLGEASSIFMKTIPFQIFPILACIIALLFALGLFPKIGPMKKAYELAAQGIQMGAEEGGAEDDDATMIEEMVASDSRKQNVSVWNLIIPMAAIVFAMFNFDFDGFKVFGFAIIVTGLLYIPQGLFTLGEYVDCFLQGARDMMDMTIILIFGYGLAGCMGAMGFESFALDVCSLIPIPALLPFIFFVYFALEEYLMTMNYTLYQILIPVLIVILPATGANVPLCLGAIMSAALFGANTCIISDLGIIAAKSCRIKIFDQYICCQPYYWIAAGVTAVAYLALGFIL